MRSTKFFQRMATAVLVGFIAIGAMNLTACDSVASGNRTNHSGIQEARFSPPANITINTPAELAQIGIRYPASGTYDLGSDLVLTNWTPICETATGGPFTGTFDGAGHTITVNSFDSTVLSNSQNIGIFALSARGASFTNLNVNLAVSPGSFSRALNVGGLVGYAEGTTFTDITVTGTFNATYTGTAPSASPLVKPIKGADSYHALIPGATKTDGLNAGGVAGYAGVTSSFSGITARANINAVSTQTPVFVGGVVGFAEDSSIAASVNSGAITGNGPGYNTSAGGIAGYIEHTTVTSSSSGGAISANATGGAKDDADSWQIDVGGLVGYSGGNPVGPSLITNSFATGTVTATGPFPYAGGLVGYNYGYSIFEPTPSSGNGSTISKSYATGNVTATSQTLPGPTQQYGNIPYAGGLVGYNSMVGSTIEDSYATGNAIVLTPGTYAWAGGVVGGNANDAVVTRTYATGSISNTVGTLAPIYPPYNGNVPGPASGGIAGFNYYSAATTVSSSVALNSLIDTNNTTQDVVHRVAGSLGNTTGYIGTLNNNLANQSMPVNTIVNIDFGPNGLDGGSITSFPPPQSDYTGLGWNFSTIWQLIGTYPTLR
jgi:hypothetical protein